MFGSLGGAEIIAILILALILFGPRRLPEIGRTIAKGLNEFRKATHDFRSTLEREVDMEEVREVKSRVEDSMKQVRALSRGSILDAAPPRRPAPPPRRDPDPADDAGSADDPVGPPPPAPSADGDTRE